MLSPLYMAEISPPEVRGSLIALEQFAIVLGVVCGFWIGFFTRSGQSFYPLSKYLFQCTDWLSTTKKFQDLLLGASLWEFKYFWG
jgi:hypothetical protein